MAKNAKIFIAGGKVDFRIDWEFLPKQAVVIGLMVVDEQGNLSELLDSYWFEHVREEIDEIRRKAASALLEGFSREHRLLICLQEMFPMADVSVDDELFKMNWEAGVLSSYKPMSELMAQLA